MTYSKSERKRRNRQLRKALKDSPELEKSLGHKLGHSGSWIVTIRAPLRKPLDFRERIPIPDAIKMAVITRDHKSCRYCGLNMSKIGGWEFDHVIPVSQGGPTNLSNLVMACRKCNRKKGAQVWTPL